MTFFRYNFYRQMALICLLFFLSARSRAQTSSCICDGNIVKSEKGTGSISGKVMFGATNTPSKGQTVWLYKDGILFAKLKSGKKGDYRINKLTPGKYELRVCNKDLPAICIPGIYVENNKSTHINIFLNNPKEN